MKDLQRQFVNLSTEEKVSRVNEALQSEDLKHVAMELTGCSVTWLRGHMETLGYRYNRSLGQYFKTDPVKPQKANREAFEEAQELLAVKDQLLALVGARSQSLNINFQDLYQRGEVTTRSFRTYSGVLEAFDAVCDTDYPQYRKQDLLGVALLDFVRRYRKEPVTN